MEFNRLNVVNVVMRSAVRAYSAHVSVATPTSDVTQHVHSTAHARRTTTSCSTSCVCPPVGALGCWVVFFSSLARLSLSPVSPWPRGRHPPRIRSRLLSRSPQVSFILFCVLLSTSRVPPPLAYPRPGTLSTVRVSPAGGYLHSPAGVSLRSSPPAKHPRCAVHVRSLLLPRVPWNALRHPHLSACIPRARRHRSGGYLHSKTTRRAPLACSCANNFAPAYSGGFHHHSNIPALTAQPGSPCANAATGGTTGGPQ